MDVNVENLKFDEKGLIPAVVIDCRTKKVLTVAYMNREKLGDQPGRGTHLLLVPFQAKTLEKRRNFRQCTAYCADRYGLRL